MDQGANNSTWEPEGGLFKMWSLCEISQDEKTSGRERGGAPAQRSPLNSRHRVMGTLRDWGTVRSLEPPGVKMLRRGHGGRSYKYVLVSGNRLEAVGEFDRKLLTRGVSSIKSLEAGWAKVSVEGR